MLSLLALLAPLALLLPGVIAEDAFLATHARSGGATATLLVPAESLSYEALSRKYGVETLDAAGVAAYVAEHGLDRHVPPSGQAAAGASFLQVASKALAKVGVIANGCEICNYVMENKQMHQPFLCRGLKDPAQQQTVRYALTPYPLLLKYYRLQTCSHTSHDSTRSHSPLLTHPFPTYTQCVSVLISMMWWLENTVYWNNYGCQRQQGGGFEWVKPCPSHATCGWIQNLYDRSQYCPSDPAYRKPGA